MFTYEYGMYTLLHIGVNPKVKMLIIKLHLYINH